ncbi:MAG: 3-deoxy-7-phosphoheptulonate synthase [Gammaproteobacteria bacterium]|nr:3-deoxy-7-phosphoheptulonate synthase [Gammaproteobacteria bacterium]
MTISKLEDVNVNEELTLITPESLHSSLPLSDTGFATVQHGRHEIEAILDRQDHRLLVVVGPCSIHDTGAAQEYASRLLELRKELGDTLCIVMRVYFEKPRTTVGWKGLINDPRLDGSFRIEEGLYKARELLVWMADSELPTGTEVLDPISSQYLGDLFSWSAIGARTTESQTHREIASGLSTPVGFKNGTDGGLDVAINAMQSAASDHRFLGINHSGKVSVIRTAGNRYGHVILRGGKEPNYDSVNISLCEQALEHAGLPSNIIVDCSHANSHKKPELQPLVAENLASQIREGNKSIIGIMLESHLGAGSQKIPDKGVGNLQYGVSITDACIDWENTEATLRALAKKITTPLSMRIE